MSSHDPSLEPSSETTPLLSRADEDTTLGINQNSQTRAGETSADAESVTSLESPEKKKQKRWPTIVALTILCLAALTACFGLAVPTVVEQYAKEGIVFEPTKLSIDSFTSFGVRARVQGTFYLDASRVHKKSVRDIGRFGTWIAREVKSGESEVQVFLPGYGNVLLGVVTVPPVKVDIRDGHRNEIDFLADVEPGDVDAIRRVAKDFMSKKLDELTIRAVAAVPIRSGIISLGTQTIEQVMRFQGHDVPAVPDLDIQKLRLAEYGMPGHPEGLKAMANVIVFNRYPVNFNVPPLAFEVLVPDCFDDYLLFGTASTDQIHVLPNHNISASVTGIVQQLPTSLTTACPGSHKSPLDHLIGEYLSGGDTTVYIRGGKQNADTPTWIVKLLQDTMVPFSLPGHPFDNLIKEFHLANVHFSLPGSSTDSHPRVSAVVQVLVGLPAEMNVNLDVDKVRADADVYYKGDLLGKLDLQQWQQANATQIKQDLFIQSVVENAPLDIKDDAVFSKVVKELLFGDGAHLSVRATVDANTKTALGVFTVRNIPAKGEIFVKPIGRGGFEMPEIKGMEIVDATENTLTLQARVNVTNPTEYSASVPRVNVSILVNETRVAYAWASGNIVPGPNEVTVQAAYEVGAVAREWLSQLVSGYNTSITVKTHRDSVPSIPDPKLSMTIPTPRLFSKKFIKETTMHILSSTATFVLVSPFAMFITNIAAAAYYNGTEVGTINWDYPFAIDEGETISPKLPVDWGSNALKTIRDALGGTLKLDARADVGVRVGEWREQLWYEGKGLGAHIQL